MKRYRVMQRALKRMPDGTWTRRQNPPFAIFDEVLGDFCALPVDGKLKPLEWRARSAAYDWLYQCGETWQEWERSGRKADVPQDWRGFRPPANSPWEGHTTPMYGPY
ncbi:hypothetical protein [Streptomyces sp. NPDC046832]|uniref:hypothetical protein n=1 Tax=Streptomyces sp. NPDC046832 TaxID=3155020 RepID=UPI0033CFFFCF